jgi:hypothetical protein
VTTGSGGMPTAGTLLAAMLVRFGMPNAVWRQCDVRATAKAPDGIPVLLSGVPIPGGCRSPLPLGPTFAFQGPASGCCQQPPAGGPLAADLSKCTRRIQSSVSRRWPGPTVAAGVSELGPAMSDGESAPDEL